ncbi:MAG: RICIN domain-containing protein, partial [Clostridia bacterium]|nr:RICIN domain-containing protein [Clostridia bacterium]
MGAWAKAHSAPLNNGTKDGDTCLPDFELKIQFFNSSDESVSVEEQSFNPDVKTWQFNSFCAIAEGDYAYAKVSVIYDNNINELSTTGIYCNKEEYGQTYTYDKNGNVVSSTDLASTTASFAYKGNQMSMLLNPSGSSYLYSYDSETNNLLYANSTDGQQYSFTYDDKGNATQCVIEESRPATILLTSETYVLRNAYSGNALDADDQTTDNKNINNYHYEVGRENQQWVIETTGTDDVYKLKSVEFNKYLNVADNKDGTKFTLASSSTSNKQQFKIVANGNGTFRILTAISSNAKCVDGQPGDSTDTADDTVISQQPFDENDVGQQWYFYPLVDSSDKKITSSATYTEDKNFVSTVTDALGNTVSYDYDSTKDTMSSTTDAKGNTLNYVYDDNNRITDIKDGSNTDLISYSYENDRLSSINAYDSTFYDFTYDAFGNTTRTRVGNGNNFYTLATNTYDSYGKLTQMTYGNGNFVNYSYDSLDRITEKSYNGSVVASYRYNNNGNLSVFTDIFKNELTRNIYDLSGRLVAINTYNGTNLGNLGTLKSTLSYRYADKTNYLTGISHTVPDLGISNKLDFTYGNLANGQMPDQIYSVKWNDVSKKNYTYDGLGRVTSQTVYPSVGRSLYSTYTYKDTTANTTTTIVSGVQSSLGDYSYQYDANGNITRIDYNNLSVATFALTQYQVNYEYDELNQLIRCYGDNISYGGTYTYDDNGNITSKNNNTYGYTNSVWGDLLTSYNGNTITYDTIGNPLTYKNGENFMWQNGRRLNMILDGDDITAVYYYDVSGSRISKSTEAGDTFFTYAGDILAAQKTGNNILVWIYDNNGAYIGFSYNGTEYYYIYNLQGDVEALADSNGTIIARYTYDPWGKIVAITDAALNDISSDATHIANINPIRYRGYYYDTETNFYYLNSRYYDPEICRFINADGAVSGVGGDVQGYNLFAYCMNNPVNMNDTDGNWPKWIKAVDNWINDKIIKPVVNTYNNIKEDINNYNKYNEDPEVVFSSNYFSSYKGTFVLKTSFDASFFYGFIGLSKTQQTETNLNHEYG